MRLHLADDSGILSLLDCSTYSPFVGEDWEYEQLLMHFKSQATHKSIVVWDAGDGGNDYRIDISLEATDMKGFREASSQITVRGGQLHLASYTAVTMAAQFSDERLPSETEAKCCIALPNGEYALRIVQMYNPARCDEPAEDKPHFIIEVLTQSKEHRGNVLWL
jgi:hypothetical protein